MIEGIESSDSNGSGWGRGQGHALIDPEIRVPAVTRRDGFGMN